MDLVLAGFLAFIISGLDDFTVLVMLFMASKNKIHQILSITFGTLLMLIIIVYLSYFIIAYIENYIWIISILIIIYSIKIIVINYKDKDNKKDDNLKISKNLFFTAMWIFLVNAGDDLSIYSLSFSKIYEYQDKIYFSLGIILSGISTIILAYILARIISNIDSIREKLDSLFIKNLPYYIMLTIGILTLIS